MKLAPAEELLAALIATPAGVSRATSKAAAAELQQRGHPLHEQGDAWVLDCAARHFDPAAFAAAQSGELGVQLEVWEESDSTNDLARAGAERGAPHGALWLAESQTQGRGRQGRAWTCAPHAGLLVSWLMREPPAPLLPATLLPLALGLGACEGLRQRTGLAVRTKWPNDLWLGERKLAGLLVEARAGRDPITIVGFGMNVGGDAIDAALLPRATSLAAGGVEIRREPLLAAILAAIERRLADWRRGDAAALVAAWLELDLTQGRTVRVEGPGGVLEGRVTGITGAGLLRLETASGVQHDLVAGEVHLQ